MRRAGVTILEVLVVISIVALLAALLLPAITSARSAARSLQCKNNLRNIALAMFAQAQSSRRYPASGNIGYDQTGNLAPYHSWVLNVLPWLERKDVFREWNFSLPSKDPANQHLARIHLPVLACPDDITVVGQGDLSYVVNGGFGWTSVYQGIGDCPLGADGVPIDLNGNAVVCPPQPDSDGRPNDKILYFRSGLFFLESWNTPGTTRHHRPDTVMDGLSNTLMVAENVRAGFDPYVPNANWATPEPRRNSFFLSQRVCLNSSCSPGNVNYQLANSGLGAINSSLTEPEGEAPWPSSFHSRGVHVAFADGRVVFLSEAVDGAVYVSLVSPQGMLLDGPLRQQLVGSDSF